MTELPNSFNDFFANEKATTSVAPVEKSSLEDTFTKEREKWVKKIQAMSAKLKNILDIQILMVNIYSDRQMAIEYYHKLLSLLVKVNKEYRSQYTTKYNHYSFNSQKRFPNETTKNNQILSEMEDIISKKESMNNMLKYIENTVKTIDNIIYGMKYRIEIEQISRGQ